MLQGDNSAQRGPEIGEIARWLRDWAHGGDEFGENLMTLGDFNIDRVNDPSYQEFVATRLRPRKELESLPRTIFQDPAGCHFYDQIAFVRPTGSSALTPPLRYANLGANSDFVPALKGQLTTTQLSWRISDHYPLGPASQCGRNEEMGRDQCPVSGQEALPCWGRESRAEEVTPPSNTQHLRRFAGR